VQILKLSLDVKTNLKSRNSRPQTQTRFHTSNASTSIFYQPSPKARLPKDQAPTPVKYPNVLKNWLRGQDLNL
ncbi:MAG: hypothetical protein FWD77_03885, partial [Betaproteobacteria bacterium]|nr:hypothetical protein [Betaproteobacteria bacterium]